MRTGRYADILKKDLRCPISNSGTLYIYEVWEGDKGNDEPDPYYRERVDDTAVCVGR